MTASASIRNPQTFNRYSYVLNSPYKYTDPLGLLPLSFACGGGCPGSFMGIEGSGVFNSRDPWATQQPTDEGSTTTTHESAHDGQSQQDAQQPDPPPAPSAEQNAETPQIQQEDLFAVFVTGGVFLTTTGAGNKFTKAPPGLPVKNPQLDDNGNPVFLTDAYSDFTHMLNVTMQVKDSNGNLLENYEYETSDNSQNSLGTRRKQAIDGEAHIGLFTVHRSRNANNLNIPESLSNDFSGSVTIYRNGAKYANATFSVSTTGNNVTELSEPVLLEWKILP